MNLDYWRLSRNTWTWKAFGLILVIFLRTLEWFNPLRACLQTNFAVQLRSPVQLFVTTWIVACQAPLSSAISWSLLKFMYIELVIVSSHLTLCHPLLLLSSIFPSIRVIRWPKYWSFSFSNSPSSAYSGLISFKIDCFDLLAVQGTLKSILQKHNLKTSILALVLSLVYSLVLISIHDYLKNQSFCYTVHSKVMSLLFFFIS